MKNQKHDGLKKLWSRAIEFNRHFNMIFPQGNP